MAYCRTHVPIQCSGSPEARLRPLLEQLGLVVEQPDHRTLVAFERCSDGRPAGEALRIWADWNDVAGSGELWLEALSSEGHGCTAMLERIRSGLSR